MLNFQLIYHLTVKNLKLKYKQTVLGFLWSLLTPLFFLMIFNFVFGHAFQTIERYPLYVLTGLIFWQFFSNASNQAIQSFLQNSGIIKTINIPLRTFPMAAVVTEFISLLLSLIPFTILMLFFGLKISWHSLLIFPILALFVWTIYNFGSILGLLNVYMRDVGILWNTISPALFYLTPIAYDPSIIPEKYQVFIQLNPLYHFFDSFHAILYNNQLPQLKSVLIMSAIGLVTWILKLLIQPRLEKGVISNM